MRLDTLLFKKEQAEYAFTRVWSHEPGMKDPKTGVPFQDSLVFTQHRIIYKTHEQRVWSWNPIAWLKNQDKSAVYYLETFPWGDVLGANYVRSGSWKWEGADYTNRNGRKFRTQVGDIDGELVIYLRGGHRYGHLRIDLLDRDVNVSHILGYIRKKVGENLGGKKKERASSQGQRKGPRRSEGDALTPHEDQKRRSNWQDGPAPAKKPKTEAAGAAKIERRPSDDHIPDDQHDVDAVDPFGEHHDTGGLTRDGQAGDNRGTEEERKRREASARGGSRRDEAPEDEEQRPGKKQTKKPKEDDSWFWPVVGGLLVCNICIGLAVCGYCANKQQKTKKEMMHPQYGQQPGYPQQPGQPGYDPYAPQSPPGTQYGGQQPPPGTQYGQPGTQYGQQPPGTQYGGQSQAPQSQWGGSPSQKPQSGWQNPGQSQIGSRYSVNSGVSFRGSRQNSQADGVTMGGQRRVQSRFPTFFRRQNQNQVQPSDPIQEQLASQWPNRPAALWSRLSQQEDGDNHIDLRDDGWQY